MERITKKSPTEVGESGMGEDFAVMGDIGLGFGYILLYTQQNDCTNDRCSRYTLLVLLGLIADEYGRNHLQCHDGDHPRLPCRRQNILVSVRTTRILIIKSDVIGF